MMEQNILELTGLTKNYDGFSLSNIDLKLPQGCVMGVIGENGAGKSTLIKAIMGLICTDAGEVRFFGSAGGAGPDSVKEWIKEDIGVVLGGLCLPATMDGGQICRMMEGIYKNWDSQLFNQYLERFKIERKKKIKDYSKGMGMKAAIAIALSHKAKLLILDEPTDGLDPVAREELLDILREFVSEEDHSVLISSHIISDLEKIADYIAFLHGGELLLCEEKDALLEEYRIMKGGKAEIEAACSAGNIRIVGVRENNFGASALVRLEQGFCPTQSVVVETAGLEDIMIYLVKEGRVVER